MHRGLTDFSSFFAAHCLIQPGASQEPEAVGNSAADSQHVGGLPVLKAREETQLDERRSLRIVFLQFIQRFMHRQEFIHAVVVYEEMVVEFLSLRPTTALQPLFVPRPFYEDPAHRLRGSGEEMTAAVPSLGLLHIHQPEIRLVNQSRSFKRLSWLFLSEFLRRQLA
jgi:hypothetical protein